MNNTTIARHIKKEWHDFYAIVKTNEREIGTIAKILTENGYEVMSNNFGSWYATKNGLRFYCSHYSSEYRLHVDYGFYVGSNGWEHGKYIRIFNVDKEIESILAAGYVLPENHYVRSSEVEDCIKTIKSEIEKARAIVCGGGYGERGDRLYCNGYKVGYDGGSVCDFSKGFLHFHAHNDYPCGWKLDDGYNAYIGDDVFSIDFSLNSDRYLNLDRDFEAIFGGVPTFGRELTEKDKIGRYNKFRVRTYVPRELNTIGWFDTFEEARKFAYDKAKEYAESVKDDRRRYAYTNPRDISDRYDYLAAYLWYDGGIKHFVFVQGENE